MELQKTTGHPRGLYLLFVTEMWERFSYYGMRAIFILYMTKALLFDKALSSAIYGDYTGLVYLTPLLGGFISDRYWGNRKSIIFGGILMAIGQFCLFLSGSMYEQTGTATSMMFLGLGFLIFGNGFFKPNISTMVGSLYPDGDRRVDSAFTIFYMGINAGALIAPVVCGGVGDTGSAGDFKWGFLAACIGMIVSIILFIMFKNKYTVRPDGSPVGAKPERKKAVEGSGIPKATVRLWLGIGVVLFFICKGIINFDYILSIIFTASIVVCALIISDKGLSKIEKDRIWVIFLIAFFVIFFWMSFEQAGASLTFFAEEQTDRNLMGWTVPSSYFQTINPFAIVVLAPLFAWLWISLGSRGKEPSSPMKQSIGLLLLAVGYIVIIFAVKDLPPGQKVSMIFLFSLYLIHTIGELCLSPIGLSMVMKLAPARMSSLLMGVWFMSTALANKFAGDLSALYPEEVKKVESVKAYNFKFADAIGTKTLLVDTSCYRNSFRTLIADKSISFTSTIDQRPKPKALNFLETFTKNLKSDPLISALSSKSTDSILVLKAESVAAVPLDSFKIKQILVAEGLKNADPKDYAISYSSLQPNTVYLYKPGKTPGDATLQIWDTNPKKPVIAGYEIKDLYSFFSLFAILSGVAALALFLFVPKLLKMMHGIR